MKKYWYIISGLLFTVLIFAIVFQETKGDYFKQTAEDVYILSQDKNLLINDEAIAQLKIKPLIVSISESEEKIITSKEKTITTSLTDLLGRENRKRYRNNKTIILQCNDYEQAACAWVILARRGYKNVRIYNDDADTRNEYTFQSDQKPD